MAFNFKKNKTNNKKRFKKPFVKNGPPKTSAKDLVDPVLFVGDLDSEKYPRLEQKQDDRNTQEVENPLNQRR
ncbi:hypothetical protein H6761_03245 [Candidatus Nomurabacteria bacterium]|nr:hypothetical protein [Candidatus Nomurabacteria bacterium]